MINLGRKQLTLKSTKIKEFTKSLTFTAACRAKMRVKWPVIQALARCISFSVQVCMLLLFSDCCSSYTMSNLIQCHYSALQWSLEWPNWFLVSKNFCVGDQWSLRTSAIWWLVLAVMARWSPNSRSRQWEIRTQWTVTTYWLIYFHNIALIQWRLR